jgi:hypothetical protein
LFEKLLAFPDSNLVYFRQAGLRWYCLGM